MLTWLRKKMRVIMIVVAVVFAASMFYGIGAARRVDGGRRQSSDLARINGKPVEPRRYGEMLNRLVRQFGQEVQPSDVAFLQNLALGQTIDFMLILDQAKRNVRVSGRELDASIDNMIKQQGLGSREGLEQALKRMGLSMRQFREMIKDEIYVQKMMNKMRSEVSVAPEDLREIRASHILVSEEAKAKDLLTKVNQGGNFAALAKKYSIDPGSAVKGGDLGYFTTGMMVTPFEEAAFKLKINETSGLVKSDFGYHIIKLTDSRLRKFGDDVTDIDKAALEDKQDKSFRKWFGGLKNKAKIEIVNPALKAHDLRYRGRIGEAVQAYQEAIALNPGDPYLHVFLADTLNTIGRSELAITEYEKAIAIEGGNPALYIVLAKAYEASGQKDKAVKQYKRASIVAGDNLAFHEELLKKFKELKAWPEHGREQREIARLKKKEQFEKELRGEGE